MKLRQIAILSQVVMEFFAWEAIWGASAVLRAIYWTRMLLLCVPIVAALTIVEAVWLWPRASETGEEHLVTRRELGIVQERNREVQSDLRQSIEAARVDVRDLQNRQGKLENFQQRIEEKFDLGAKILGAICSVLIGQLISYLLNIRLRRELRAMNQREVDT